MNSRYVFISNSTKPTKSERASREEVRLTNFSRPCLEVASDLGYEVYLGVNRDRPSELRGELGIKYYDASTYRNVLDLPSIFTAVKNLRSLLREGGFDVVHCNTPIGGMVGRIGGRIAGVRKVIYTAHGFHFYRGAPFLRNIVFRTVEAIMARMTDAIITINSEDFEAASRFKLRDGGRVYQVPGVGIDVDSIDNVLVDRAEMRRELGVPEQAFLFCSTGDLIPRKDFTTAIKAMSQISSSSTHLVVCGEGPELSSLRVMTQELGLNERVHFLGRRNDVPSVLKASDGYLFTSHQEGLARSVMEAMASGLPCVVSRIRGNVDLIEQGKGGYLCNVGDAEDFAVRMRDVQGKPSEAKKMGDVNRARAQEFHVDRVRAILREIYSDVLS